MKRRFYVTVYGLTAVRGTDNRTMMTFFEAWSMRGFILSKDPKADVRIMSGGAQVKRTRIKPVSDKRRLENKERAIMMNAKFGDRPWKCRFDDFMDDALRENGVLAAWPPFVMARRVRCHGNVNGHEIIKASAWRAGRLDPDNVTTLCDFHNGYVEDYPLLAREIGLSKRKEP